MFGIANQLLACTALCVATTILLREARRRSYALITLGPLLFVGTTTLTAGVESIRRIFLPMVERPETRTMGFVNVGVTSVLIGCIVLVMIGSAVRWWSLARAQRATAREAVSSQ